MDRKTWLAVGLSIVGILLFQWYYQATYGPYLRQQEELRRKQTAAAPPAASPIATPTASPPPVSQPVQPSAPVMTAQSASLTSQGTKDRAQFFFNNDTGGISSVQLLMHRSLDQTALSLNRDPRMPIGALAATPGMAMGGFEMRADRTRGVVVFTKRDADGLEIAKKFTLAPDRSVESPYVANLEITFSNTSAVPVSRPTYFLSAGAASPIHPRDLPTYTRFDWSSAGRMTGRDVNSFSASSIPLVGIQLHPAQESFTEAVAGIDWTAVTSQYFCTILSALDEKGASVWGARFVVADSTPGQPVYGIQGEMGLPGFTVEPGKSITRKFQIYAGPKELARLDALGHNEEAVMNFGWFGFISKFLLWAMNSLHSLLFNSYAAAIVVLTLLIKSALWPLQNKATNSMRRMSALSPKMTELREKYKDDPTKMNEELMKLYRDYGVNPFSGCLPMLIQIPIFFGFYGMLGTAIELRNSSFLWIHDLSQPDTVGYLPGIHFPINILPLVMAGTMVWQMAISPKTGDAMQQRMMMFMPVIFIAFAYNYASALSLYWTTQNLFSIIQLYLTRNRPLPTLEKMKVAAKRKAIPAAKTRKKRP
ncbi:MAG: membrane protein insertase YidC [Terrimicrobiaceae bacterium]|nr:membrane protein insertase YidC [Terrimicrobiaceae bacterium]